MALKLQADFDFEAKFRLNCVRRKGSGEEYTLRRGKSVSTRRRVKQKWIVKVLSVFFSSFYEMCSIVFFLQLKNNIPCIVYRHGNISNRVELQDVKWRSICYIFLCRTKNFLCTKSLKHPYCMLCLICFIHSFFLCLLYPSVSANSKWPIFNML